MTALPVMIGHIFFRSSVESLLGSRPEGQSTSGRLEILQEDLKTTGQGCPLVPKDKPEGLAKQRALSGTREEKESLWNTLEKGAGKLTRTVRMLRGYEGEN